MSQNSVFFFFSLTYAELRAFNWLKAIFHLESAEKKKNRLKRTDIWLNIPLPNKYAFTPSTKNLFKNIANQQAA